MSEPETLFTTVGRLGRIVLNRPQALNALSPCQFVTLADCLADWAKEPGVAAIVIEGAGGRAFSAGGDIKAVWENRRAGRDGANRVIFRDEYRLDRMIHHYPKPYVAILDGVVMGGGAGVSVNGRYRIATERTLFAMPETAIGFFPDVGATWFLSRCPGRVGLYLGLTGARLGPADCLWAGIATHFVPSAEVDALRAALAAGDPAEVLDRFHRDPGPSALVSIRDRIDHCFGGETLGCVLKRLADEAGEWADAARQALARHCPFSLAVTFRQLTKGRDLSFDDAIRREYRLACRFLDEPDFYEGIRAMVVDKDKAPRWVPPSLDAVDEAIVAAAFAPLGEDELEFFPVPGSF